MYKIVEITDKDLAEALVHNEKTEEKKKVY